MNLAGREDAACLGDAFRSSQGPGRLRPYSSSCATLCQVPLPSFPDVDEVPGSVFEPAPSQVTPTLALFCRLDGLLWLRLRGLRSGPLSGLGNRLLCRLLCRCFGGGFGRLLNDGLFHRHGSLCGRFRRFGNDWNGLCFSRRQNCWLQRSGFDRGNICGSLGGAFCELPDGCCCRSGH
jgi:hypothetical protein